MCKFKVGDKIRPNHLAEDAYSTTIGKWRGVVISVEDGRHFRAQSIGCGDGEKYYLNDKFFELVKNSTPEEAFWNKVGEEKR